MGRERDTGRLGYFLFAFVHREGARAGGVFPFFMTSSFFACSMDGRGRTQNMCSAAVPSLLTTNQSLRSASRT